MRKSIIAAGMALLTAHLCYADSYQTELRLGYTDAEGEASNVDTNTTLWLYGSTFYLNKVESTDGPLYEAAFMQRRSNVGAYYLSSEIDVDYVGSDRDLGGYGFSGRWVERQNGWILSFGYDHTDWEFLNTESDIWTLGLGKYIAKNTEVFFVYNANESDFDGAPRKQERKTSSLFLKHVAPLSGEIYHRIEAGYSYVDEDSADAKNIWKTAYVLYPRKYFGVGIEVQAVTNSDRSDEQAAVLFGRWFVTNQVAVSVGFMKREDDKANHEEETFLINTDIRF